MGLKTFVKVSDINNLSDARYCAGMGVDILGFNIEIESENFVSPEKFSEISGWLSGVQFAAEFEYYDEYQIKDIIGNYQVQFIQTSRIELLDPLLDLNIPLILKLDLTNPELRSIITKNASKVAFFVINGNFDLIALGNHNHDKIVLHKIDLDSTSVLELSEKIKGIELKAAKEIKPGFGDFDKIADILEALETED